MPSYSLRVDQVQALEAEFGDLLDVAAEIDAAKHYAEHMHGGRPYKNFGRMVWNWCVRARSNPRLRARPRQKVQPAPVRGVEVDAATLRAIASDPSERPEVRDQAKQILEFLEAQR